MVWMSKVYCCSCFVLNYPVICKLSTIVEGESFPFVLRKILPIGSESTCYPYGIFSVRKSIYLKVSTLSFYHCKNGSTPIFSNHGISFPVTESYSFFYFLWSFINHSSILYLVLIWKECLFFLSVSVFLSLSTKAWLDESSMMTIYLSIYSIFGESTFLVAAIRFTYFILFFLPKSCYLFW